MKRIILEEPMDPTQYTWAIDINHDNSLLFVAARNPKIYVIDLAQKKLKGMSIS